MNIQDAHIVYIDDNKFNLALIKAFADELKLNLKIFLEPKEALKYVLNNDVDLILVDYMMPELNGIEFARKVKEKKPFIPIIMISAFDDYKLRAQAREAGIDDFLPKPVSLDSFQNRIINKLKNLEKHKVETVNIQEEKSTTDKNLYEVFSKVCYPQDKEYKNVLNIAKIAKMIALELKDEEYANKIYSAAFFYDIGKNKIPLEILLKPSTLSEAEFELVKSHTTLGYDILNVEDEIMQVSAIMALNHHEKFNGKGYLRGLEGENIPLCARIISLVDVFDALLTKKTYRDKFSLNEAVNFIISEKNKSFDPNIVDIFINKIDKIRLKYL